MIRSCLMIAAALASVPALAAERRFDVAGFDKVAVAGSENVVIRQGSNFSVIASGGKEDLDRLEVGVANGTLGIGQKKGTWNWSSDGVTITVTLPALRGLSAGGSGDVQVDKGSGDVFDLRLGGSGDVNVGRITAKAVNASLAGSGNLKAGGQCGALKLRLAGSGDVDLSALACSNADISVAGSGNVLARASTQAVISVAGSGDVLVTGGAKCTKRVVGSGEVTCN